MNVIKASVLGFCFGVRRAVDVAEEVVSSDENKNKKIFSLGPLIHNPVVLDELEKKGVHVIDPANWKDAPEDSLVIVRAHGTTPGVMNELAAKGSRILDATCPRVHASQLLAQKWSAQGYTVIIAGDKNHGEVTGISGYAENNAVVIQNLEDAEALPIPEKAILLAQTTFSPKEFARICEEIQTKSKNTGSKLEVFNTICNATMQRQDALKEVAVKADAIIVIGGKSSANTRRLWETALTYCSNSYLIENASQIPSEIKNFETVAITAGASTPDSVINEVVQNLQNL